MRSLLLIIFLISLFRFPKFYNEIYISIQREKKYVKQQILCNLYWKKEFLISSQIVLRGIEILVTDADHKENFIYYLDKSFWCS